MTTLDSFDSFDDTRVSTYVLLSREFAGAVPLYILHEEIDSALCDLRGQVPPDSIPEMAHRPAR